MNVKKIADGGSRRLGRPTAYQDEYSNRAYLLCLLKNATDADLAEHFEVSRQTVISWKKKHPEFLDALTKGKTTADTKVAASLFALATGSQYKEEIAIKVRNQSAPGVFTETVQVIKVTKTLPPNVIACFGWLKNRQPKHWRDKVLDETSSASQDRLDEIIKLIDQGPVDTTPIMEAELAASKQTVQ